MASPRTCTVCTSTTSLRRCARCSTAYYCSATCQRVDWPSHKASCNKRLRPWYDAHRRCEDGSKHEGRLELIKWSTQAEDAGGEDMGWGNILAEESEGLKRKFDEEFRGDEEKLHEYWPQAFRWTCCGVLAQGEMGMGCDHHGRGKRACSCDFCQVGTPQGLILTRMLLTRGRIKDG